MTINPLLRTDSYKASHFCQYPPDTEGYFGYVEARRSMKALDPYKETVFFGLQMFLKEYMTDPITHDDVNEAKEFFDKHGEPFSDKTFHYIVDEYNGYWPVTIRAPPEGTVIQEGNVLATIEDNRSQEVTHPSEFIRRLGTS